MWTGTSHIFRLQTAEQYTESTRGAHKIFIVNGHVLVLNIA